jgi:predicted nucleic acid-binding protein
VKAFLDSSVLVATFYGDHQHHPPSIALYARQNRTTGCTAAHCLAELYSVATGMPGKNRASPGEVLPFLHDVRDRLQIVTPDDREYWQAVENAAMGISGGAIYDALIGECALKAGARTIYTWNTRLFQLLRPEIATRAKEPR